MLDIVNSDATQERARNLNALFAGKQIADTYTPGAPRNTVAFTDGTHVAINAATILPGGATAPADNKALAERNLRPEKIAEVSGEYAAHSDLRPTLILENSDGTTISAADAALEPQW